MRILLTNDDGIDARGICILEEVLSESHEVCVVAPCANRSGSSSSISMYSDQKLVKKSEKKFFLDGSPVDCVISALRGGYIPFVPEVVISGINNGANLGTDIIYSGTCGAARQASLYGVPGLALSIDFSYGECSFTGSLTGKSEKKDSAYRSLSYYVRDNMSSLLPLCGTKDSRSGSLECFVNVNAPFSDEIRGTRQASVCSRVYGDRVDVSCGCGTLYSSCRGGGKIASLGDACGDGILVENGFVSVSAVYAQPVAKYFSSFSLN